MNWESQSTINTASGLLCVWNKQTFKGEMRVSGRGYILLEGTWTQEMQKIFIVNVYAPCDAACKRILWDSIRQLKSLAPTGLWCILGDFNSIRHPFERVSMTQREGDLSSTIEFNDWLAVGVEMSRTACRGLLARPM